MFWILDFANIPNYFNLNILELNFSEDFHWISQQVCVSFDDATFALSDSIMPLLRRTKKLIQLDASFC